MAATSVPSSSPPIALPPAMAKIHTVMIIACAMSAAVPAVLADAVWNSVGAAPSAIPKEPND